MPNSTLLNAIINPKGVDLLGARRNRQQMQLGEQQLQMGELQLQQKQQQMAMQQQQQEARKLSGEILGQTIGGKVAGPGFDELLRKDPEAAIEITKGLGIPIDQMGRVKNLYGTAQIAQSLVKSLGTDQALGYISTEREKLKAFGIQTPIMDEFIQQFEQDPESASRGLDLFVDSGLESGILKSRGGVSSKDQAQTDKLRAETDKIRADIKHLQSKPGGLNFSDKRALNNDVTALIKEPISIKKAADRLTAVGKSKSPTDQIAAIFTFMKSLDPTSVVREGEQQQAAKTGGTTDQLIGYVNRIRGEGALPEMVFNNMIDTSKRMANEALSGSRDELEGLLEPFGSQITDETRSKLLGRVPKGFEVQEPTGTTHSSPSQLNDAQKSIIEKLRAAGATQEQIDSYMGAG